MLSCVLALVVYWCYVSGLVWLAFYSFTDAPSSGRTSSLYFFSAVCFALAVLTSLGSCVIVCLERRMRRIRVVYV